LEECEVQTDEVFINGGDLSCTPQDSDGNTFKVSGFGPGLNAGTLLKFSIENVRNPPSTKGVELTISTISDDYMVDSTLTSEMPT
jgi:hypothetical protein